MLEFSVKNQLLAMKHLSPIVSDTINYLEAEFDFLTTDWDDCVKVAHFSDGTTPYDVTLVNDAIPASAGLNLNAGTWTCYVHGNKPGYRITSSDVTFTVEESEILSGEPLPSVSLTFEEQLLLAAQESLYDLAVANGYEGTLEQWLITLGATGNIAHVNTTGKQGGTTGEYYHLTAAQHTVVENTSGTNTGDQDISGKVNTADIVNDLTHTDTNKPLSAAQGKALQDAKVNTSDIINTLISTETTKPLAAAQGKALQDGKVNASDIVNDLTHTDTNKPLSAAQGKALQDGKVNTSDIVNNLTSTDTNKPLSAAQGKVLEDGKVSKSLYSSNSVLIATTAGVPTAVQLGTYNVLGRGSGAISTFPVDQTLASEPTYHSTLASAKIIFQKFAEKAPLTLTGALASLTTTDKTNLVAAINEINALIASTLTIANAAWGI